MTIYEAFREALVGMVICGAIGLFAPRIAWAFMALFGLVILKGMS
jgi:hypothetical protein